MYVEYAACGSDVAFLVSSSCCDVHSSIKDLTCSSLPFRAPINLLDISFPVIIFIFEPLNILSASSSRSSLTISHDFDAFGK